MDFTTKASSKSPPSSLKTSGFIVPSAAPVETIMEDGETPGRPELQHFDSGTTSGDDTDYVLGQDAAFYPESVASRHLFANEWPPDSRHAILAAGRGDEQHAQRAAAATEANCIEATFECVQSCAQAPAVREYRRAV